MNKEKMKRKEQMKLKKTMTKAIGESKKTNVHTAHTMSDICTILKCASIQRILNYRCSLKKYYFHFAFASIPHDFNFIKLQ